MTHLGRSSVISRANNKHNANAFSWCPFAPAPKSRLVCQWENKHRFADDIIVQLIQNLEQKEGKVVGVFLNLYRTGEDYCPYHKDRYGTDNYTLSLGATRDFLIQSDDKSETIKYESASGDLYYMANSLHDNYKHSIPKRKKVGEKCISILFY